jgi:hypothetical protein
MNNNYILSWWEQSEKVIKRPWWKFWDKDLTKSYWFSRSFNISSKLGKFITENQDELQNLLVMFLPEGTKIFGLQLEEGAISTPYIPTSGHTLIQEESRRTNSIKNTTIPDE